MPRFSRDLGMSGLPLPTTPLHVVTIALDAMPWLPHIYASLHQLRFPWTWTVVEGVAAPVHCTSWVRALPPRLSLDGTTEYLVSLSGADPRVRHLRSHLWPGKCAMFNAALAVAYQPGILLEADSDELWTPQQLTDLVRLFERFPDRNCARFWCDYWVGPDLAITTRNTYGNHPEYEWRRAWRYEYGMRFESHEPPVMQGLKEKPFTHAETERCGLVFEHRAYACEATLRFKQAYYPEKYANALADWQRLQQVTEFPCRLAEYFPWLPKDDGALVERVPLP